MSSRSAADALPGLDARFATLTAVTEKAGKIAREAFEARPRDDYRLKGPQDYLTEADLAVEALIRSEITAAFPADAIHGEEEGGALGEKLWVIDPIDGTANFVRGVAHFCVTVAYAEHGRCELGAIVQPVTGETWIARRGKGATLNGAAIAPNKDAITDTAMLELGWSRRISASGYLSAQGRLLQAGAVIRRCGSGALALAHVADGRSDGYIEAKMHVWDCLAGLLLVSEAGGRVGKWPAGLEDFACTGPVMAAANGEIAGLLGEALELLSIVEIPYDDR